MWCPIATLAYPHRVVCMPLVVINMVKPFALVSLTIMVPHPIVDLSVPSMQIAPVIWLALVNGAAILVQELAASAQSAVLSIIRPTVFVFMATWAMPLWLAGLHHVSYTEKTLTYRVDQLLIPSLQRPQLITSLEILVIPVHAVAMLSVREMGIVRALLNIRAIPTSRVVQSAC